MGQALRAKIIVSVLLLLVMGAGVVVLWHWPGKEVPVPDTDVVVEPDKNLSAEQPPTWTQTLEGGGVLYYSFSSDEEELAWGGISSAVPLDDRNQVGILAVRDGRVKCVRSLPDGITAVAWAPNANYLAVALCSGPLLLLDTTTLKTKLEICCPGNGRGGATGLCYSPDGKFLAIGTWDNSIRILDLHKNTFRTVGALHSQARFLDFSADGRFLLAAADVIYCGVWDLEGLGAPWMLNPITAPDEDTGAIAGAFWSGNQVITACGDGYVRVWDAPTKRLVASHHAQLGPIFRAATSKRRNNIVLGVAGSAVLMSLSSGEVTRRFGPIEGALLSVTISPDESSVFVCTEKAEKEDHFEGALYRFPARSPGSAHK